MSLGYYRGNLDALVKDAVAAFGRLTPDQQTEHMRLQQESWVRGELRIGNDAQEAADRAAFVSPPNVNTMPIASMQPPDVFSPMPPKQMGYTGNTCSACGSSRMIQAGHCEACSDCGTTTGCS